MSYNNTADVAIPGRNYVDNPSFNNWQRATSFALASGTRTVVADRWKAYRGATGVTISRQAGFAISGSASSPKRCLRWARDSGNSSTTGMRLWHQLHEFVARGLAGHYVTLSFNVRAGASYSGGVLNVRIHTGTGGSEAADLSTSTSSAFATGGVVTEVSDTVTPTTTAERVYCYPLLLPDDIADLAIQFIWTPTGTAGATDYIDISNVKLEEGQEATEFIPPDAAADLAACCYTFQKTGVGFSVSVDSSTTVNIFGSIFPMRVAPTILIATAAMTARIAGTNRTSTDSTITASDVSAANDRFYIRSASFTSLTAGQSGVLTTDSLQFDAELLS